MVHASPPHSRVPPVFSPVPRARLAFEGIVGERIRANEQHWLLVAPDANPAMLQMFRDRDRRPVRDLVPWAGEFAGKYLTSAVQCYRLTRDHRLLEYVGRFVRDLIETQDESGYLGAFPHPYRLTGRTVKPDGAEGLTWDAWNHYHCMLGLLLWHEETGDEAALAACRRAADLFCQTFLDMGVRLVSTGSEEMNLAPIHVFCLLYARTGAERYLRMACEIERDFETPPAGDYVRTALAGLEFYQTPKPRWESLHEVQGIAELYLLTGDHRYHRAYEHIWRSILRGDRHNSGGFSSGERATGNPYDTRAIETCCTIAWIALSIDMLRLSGLSTVADEIELSTFNAVLGAQSASGRWWTYNTPMDGVRKASAHDIVFQARPGSPELNCCSVNGPRGLGMLADWAVMRATADDAIVVNYYGPSIFEVCLPSGCAVRLIQETRYPVDDGIVLRVEPPRPERLRLRLRIPGWSRTTTVAVNGEAVPDVRPGTYLTLERTWASGDTIRMSLDLSLHLWPGEREAAGMVSVYRGPLLLAYDQRLNPMDPGELPLLDVEGLAGEVVPGLGHPVPFLLMRVGADDRELFLCDYASAGAGGNPYGSWLPARGLPVAEFRVSVFRPPTG
ncbi:MAG: glycoside hydrolase family 127 protein [Chloroflexi bacterium]|nr:glycoside hydrolase family 127 protein [Chloroflexota bacterium]